MLKMDKRLKIYTNILWRLCDILEIREDTNNSILKKCLSFHTFMAKDPTWDM